MNIKQAYDNWAEQYDSNPNKTRDIEGIALRSVLNKIHFSYCLEIGCGTGKNTEWLATKADTITAIDFSNEMIKIARKKILSEKVSFHLADITQEWAFAKIKFDLICFSLVLEHIENLDYIFSEARKKLIQGGFIYIGELHPFKQYSGSKARFENENGLNVLTCYNHHISDFIQTAKGYGFEIIDINEFFDTDEKNSIPRILTILLKKL